MRFGLVGHIIIMSRMATQATSSQNVLYLHTTACCVKAYWLTRQPMTRRDLLIHFASSGTIFIFYPVAHYSTYVARVPNTVRLVHCNGVKTNIFFLYKRVGLQSNISQQFFFYRTKAFLITVFFYFYLYNRSANRGVFLNTLFQCGVLKRTKA